MADDAGIDISGLNILNPIEDPEFENNVSKMFEIRNIQKSDIPTLVKLEEEAYLKGNMAFRSWTEEEQKKGKLK